MNLVIVESPTKAKTITKFLGSDYKIESSFGHVRDLPKKTLGIDIKNDYEPTYEIPTNAKKTISKLKELSKKADLVILATDEDREGEAISWHLSQGLKLNPKKTQRIAFHEITKSAIAHALKHPRTLDMDLVDAQQARRILDRLVGYKLSPFLWSKIARGLSAGRVQSVAVRLIVEREKEIQNFKSQEYWTVEALLKKLDTSKDNFTAQLTKIDNKSLKKFDIANKEKARELKKNLEKCKYQILDVQKKHTTRSPLPPFTTATLQQTANARLGFSAKQTMVVAQKLYETGLITYMRTDSVNLSKEFITSSREYIKNKLGDKYLPEQARAYKAKAKNIQEAHEAIRPTNINKIPDELNKLGRNEFRLYQLIWQRALASQTSKAILDNTTVDIAAHVGAIPKYHLRATGQIIIFDGYLKIYPQTTKENILPKLNKDEKLDLEKIIAAQHFTEPPARYSDATIVKALEKYGIGRPSTYAPTISTIIARNYVERDDRKKLAPTETAFIVNDLLVEHFPKIVDYQFTAKLEDELDEIAQGKTKWQKPIDNFYKPFIENLNKKNKELSKKELTEEKSDELCPECGSPMVIKMGRYGKFLACTNYPGCKYTKNLNNSDKDKNGEKDNEQIEKLSKKHEGQKCEKCGANMEIKIGKYGPFLGCSSYPKCKNIKNINDDINVNCPQCATGKIVKKISRRGPFYACDQYPKCKFIVWSKPTGDKCDKCGALMVESKDGVKCSNKKCGN